MKRRLACPVCQRLFSSMIEVDSFPGKSKPNRYICDRCGTVLWLQADWLTYVLFFGWWAFAFVFFIISLENIGGWLGYPIDVSWTKRGLLMLMAAPSLALWIVGTSWVSRYALFFRNEDNLRACPDCKAAISPNLQQCAMCGRSVAWKT